MIKDGVTVVVSPQRPGWPFVRGVISFFLGAGAFMYEVLGRSAADPYIIPACILLMGAGAFLKNDTKGPDGDERDG